MSDEQLIEDEREIAQTMLDEAIDSVLNALDYGEKVGVELDPLATIAQRLKARGAELDFSSMPPLVQMLLSGMAVE